MEPSAQSTVFTRPPLRRRPSSAQALPPIRRSASTERIALAAASPLPQRPATATHRGQFAGPQYLWGDQLTPHSDSAPSSPSRRPALKCFPFLLVR